MGKYSLWIPVMILFLCSCQSTEIKRIKKDIIGINEQLYQIEKEQIKSGKRIAVTENSIKKQSTQTKSKKKNNARIVYNNGYKLFLEQSYQKAIDTLLPLVNRYKTDPITDNALFWIAESYLKRNDSTRALSHYKTLYRYFPFSEKADYALFKIGYIYYTQKKYSKAKLAFQRLIRDYPDSDFKKTSMRYRNKISNNRRKR